MWPLLLRQKELVLSLVIHLLRHYYAILVPVFPSLFRSQRGCSSQNASHFIIGIGQGGFHRALRQLSAWVSVKSAFLACVQLVATASRFSAGWTAFGSSWAPTASQPCPFWLLLLLASYSFRITNVCTRGTPNGALHICQSMLNLVSFVCPGIFFRGGTFGTLWS